MVSVTSEVDKGSCFHVWIPAGRNRNHLSDAQDKLDDSKDVHIKSLHNEATNNKTDPAIYVEEASHWMIHKANLGSILNASGTDSTEEEKPEYTDIALRLGVDCMRAQDSSEMNSEYEVSTLDIDENELIKILIDSPSSGDILTAENALDKIVVTQPHQL
ncbi:hypothetical protein BGZ99_003766, partial [Dissophora globulifera]